MGDVVLLDLLRARQLLPSFDVQLAAFCIIEDESLRSESLGMIQELRCSGYSVDYSMLPSKPDKQFKRAQDLKARRVIRLQREPSGNLLVSVKDLGTRQEVTLPRSEADTAFRH
jgi:histidyl-tRNA synthetase